MLTVSDVQALIVITLGDAFVLNRRVRQQLGSGQTFASQVPPDQQVILYALGRTRLMYCSRQSR